jgi:hypothetical protein
MLLQKQRGTVLLCFCLTKVMVLGYTIIKPNNGELSMLG